MFTGLILKGMVDIIVATVKRHNIQNGDTLINVLTHLLQPEAYNLEAYKSVPMLGFIRARH